jgi:ABC-type lipoprotein export system ATPase subunit
MAIRVRGLRRDFLSAGHVLQILKGVELDVAPGESVAIVGRSGGGKSTLLHLIGLLDRPTEGTIDLEGIETTKASRATRDRLRRDRIGFVFQFYHLLAELTAEQNVLLGAIRSGPRRRCSSASASPIARATCRRSCRAASVSASRSRAPSCGTRRCSCATNRPGTSTRARAATSRTS